MPTVDFGTVTLSVDDGRIDVFFPFEHSEVKDVVKSFKGRWTPERRCWIVTPRFARTDEETVVRAVEEALYASAPRKWPAAVEKFGGFACSTRKYDVKFGAGGIRIRLPAGHPCHWLLDKMDGPARQGGKHGETWLIPARSAKHSEVIPVIERAVREDEEAFAESVGPYADRTLKGSVPLTPEEADAAGYREGRVVFAEYPFVKTADPAVVNMPVLYWPFRVVERRDEPGEGWEEMEQGISLKLAYLEPAHGCRAVRKLAAMNDEDRPRRLDGPDALGKWIARRG